MTYRIQTADIQKKILGARMIDFEVRKGQDTCSGAKTEVWMNFDNGKEIIIYVDDDNIINIEED